MSLLPVMFTYSTNFSSHYTVVGCFIKYVYVKNSIEINHFLKYHRLCNFLHSISDSTSYANILKLGTSEKSTQKLSVRHCLEMTKLQLLRPLFWKRYFNINSFILFKLKLHALLVNDIASFLPHLSVITLSF